MFVREILKNKDTYNGKIEATVFFVNLFLIMVHIVLMVCYVLLKHEFMIYVNILSILFYLSCYKFCVLHKNTYISFAFIEIWIHMLLAMCAFGWHASFQNWIFGLVAAAFLPAFNTDTQKNNYKKTFIFTGLMIFTYFLFAVLICTIPFKISIEVPDIMLRFIFTFNNMVAFFTIIMFAITYTYNKERKELELTRKADFDELTKIYNRHALEEIGSNIINKCKELNKPFNVAILDIDFFKKVNDTYGHASGDIVLQDLAAILRTYSNNNIIVGRWGGEEFVIIGSYDIRYNDFVDLLKRLKTKVGKNKFVLENKKKINITISIGSAQIFDFKTLQEAVSIADNNLYKAKHSGRNKVIG